MAEFAESMNSFSPTLPFMDMDQSMEPMSQFGELSGIVMENPSFGSVGFSNDSYLSLNPDFTLPFVDNLLDLSPAEHPQSTKEDRPVGSIAERSPEEMKRKGMTVPEASSGNSTWPNTEKIKKGNRSGNGKGGRRNSKEVEKGKEVVHVRASRGQATDSHSLAERMRRERINDRMRCLQNLVPGCYKTMGMAGALDEIINYVRSLQNQVEFLSMKLSDASSSYDFSMDNEVPQVDYAYETQEVERLVREGYGGMN